MKRLAVLAVLLIGCRPQVPDDLIPFIATTGCYSLMAQAKPAPSPVPAGVCPSCRGAGTVGDGKNMVRCQTCGGTGKVTRQECKTGQCPTSTVR